jgi:hypothetical protein
MLIPKRRGFCETIKYSVLEFLNIFIEISKKRCFARLSNLDEMDFDS